jgi:chromosome segregation ATPase
MKRDFLKTLGIEDKDIIDKIMDENSADIGKAKGELQTYKDKVTELEGQIATKDGEIADLQKKVGDTDALNQQIAQLTTDKTNLTNDLNTKISEIQKTHAIEGGVRDAKARNIKAVLAQLDMTKITYENGELAGLTEQLEALKTGEDTSFLFGDAQAAPAGTHISNPPTGGGMNPPTSKTLSEAIGKALGQNQ